MRLMFPNEAIHQFDETEIPGAGSTDKGYYEGPSVRMLKNAILVRTFQH